jgi:hypothetical protein
MPVYSQVYQPFIYSYNKFLQIFWKLFLVTNIIIKLVDLGCSTNSSAMHFSLPNIVNAMYVQ